MKDDVLFASIVASSSSAMTKVFKVLYDTPLPPIEPDESYVIKIFVCTNK